MKWRPFYVFPRELWKVKRAKILLVKSPINGEFITVITRLKTRFKQETFLISFAEHSEWDPVLCSVQSTKKGGQWSGTSVGCCSCCLWIVCTFPLQVCSSDQCEWNIIKRLVYRTFSLIQSLSLFPETRRHDRDTKNVVNTFRFRLRYQNIHCFYCNSFSFKKISCHLIV